MSDDLQRQRFGYRFADTMRGDTLQAVAAREMGDAARWTDLIAFNGLVPPFITDDPAQAGEGVLLSGQALLVPAPSPVTEDTADPVQAFGVDVKLGTRGQLLTDGNDFVLCSGTDNLVQALGNRVRTERRELMFHPDYGCDVRRVIGKVNGPTKALLAAQITKASVLQDPRINRVKSAVATVTGDAIDVDLDAETVAARSVHATVSA